MDDGIEEDYSDNYDDVFDEDDMIQKMNINDDGLQQQQPQVPANNDNGLYMEEQASDQMILN